MATVADVLKRIERLKKDLEYVRSFQEKWRDQRERFPKIYEGIVAQEHAFLQKIDELRNLGVRADDEQIKSAAPSGDGTKPNLTPNIEASGNGARRRDSSDDHRQAATGEIGEKLRARQATTAK